MKFLLAFLIMAAPAAAQNNPNVDRESQDASRRGAAEKKAAEAAAAASAAAPAGDEITFEKILAAPGDLDLNERFARQQISQGDLRGAASTLERILILAPGRDRTRLLYAAVLFRLDALQDAERELRIVLGRLAPADVIEEAKAYLRLVEGRRRKTHFEARLGLGYGYDDNRNSASDTDRNLFFGTPVLLNPDSRRQDDTNVTFSGSMGALREFGGAKPQKAFVNLGYYRGEQTRINTLDLQAYSLAGGFALRWRGWELTPTAGFDHVLLSQSTFLRDIWQGARFSRKIRPRLEAYADFRHEDQGFVRTRQVTNAEDRTGGQWDYGVGANWVATPKDRFGARLGHRRKYAKAVAFAYRRESIALDYTRLFGRGVFFAAGLTAQFDRYDRPDLTLSTLGRNDDAVITNLLLGTPLKNFWAPLDGFTGTVGWERFAQDSNLINYKYSNNRVSAMISYKWGI
ncbi:MAG: tetratricopeptide repeat protein [Elusimicrobiota bacterium]|nr:MAG: tetratricopeptide repeat protein [Elusimicrobiota bacterium]